MIYDCKACNNFSSVGDREFVEDGAKQHRIECPARRTLREGKIPEGYYMHDINGKPTYFRIANYVPKAERFTGFDGIPDWTEKDSEIANLKKDYATLMNDFEHVCGVRDTALTRLSCIEASLKNLMLGCQYQQGMGYSGVYYFHVIEAIRAILSL